MKKKFYKCSLCYGLGSIEKMLFGIRLLRFKILLKITFIKIEVLIVLWIRICK